MQLVEVSDSHAVQDPELADRVVECSKTNAAHHFIAEVGGREVKLGGSPGIY